MHPSLRPAWFAVPVALALSLVLLVSPAGSLAGANVRSSTHLSDSIAPADSCSYPTADATASGHGSTSASVTLTGLNGYGDQIVLGVDEFVDTGELPDVQVTISDSDDVLTWTNASYAEVPASGGNFYVWIYNATNEWVTADEVTVSNSHSEEIDLVAEDYLPATENVPSTVVAGAPTTDAASSITADVNAPVCSDLLADGWAYDGWSSYTPSGYTTLVEATAGGTIDTEAEWASTTEAGGSSSVSVTNTGSSAWTAVALVAIATPTFDCSVQYPAGYAFFEGPVTAWFNVTVGTDTGPFEYVIDWGDESEPQTVDSSDASISETHTYVTDPGGPYYTIGLTVYNVQPSETTCAGSPVQVYPATQAPEISVSPAHPTNGSTTFFAGNDTTYAGIYSYSWDWGDGTYTNETGDWSPSCTETDDVWTCAPEPVWLNATHYYSAPGTYEVELTVEDNLGENFSADASVTVDKSTTGTGLPPCVNCGGDSGGALLREFVGSPVGQLLILIAAALSVAALVWLVSRKSSEAGD